MKCPNPTCTNHNPTGSDWYVKYGYFTPRSTRQKTPRYKCKNKDCGKIFSAHTEKKSVWQKKPSINVPLFKLLVSGVSLRRASEILDVDYNTVIFHFEYLADQSKEMHHKHMQTLKTSFIQVDELETFVHARAKALSVPMAVRFKTGEILGFAVAKMPAKGKLADIGISHYDWVVDERPLKFQSMLTSIQQCFKPSITFKSDAKGAYKTWIAKVVPHAQIEQIVGNKNVPRGSDKQFDELFAINNTFARMRHDMNRLARKTWSTTKSISGLEKHIWLYVAWNNGYKIK
jgi:transposase-like protein